jgi:DNA-binding CsgD family transcriptional regulator
MDDLVLAAYDVAVGSGQWRHLSATLAEALDCKNLVIFLFDDRSGAADLLARTGAKNQGRLEAYLVIARTMAVRHREASRLVESRRYRHAGTGPASTRVVQWNSFADSVADCCLAAMAVGGTGEGLWFCIGMDATSPMVAEEIHEKVERVLPHFCRAAEIDRNLRAAAQRSSFCDAVFDRLPFGLLQFDHNATVLYANAEAERISRLREGFVIASRKARAGSSADDATLQSAIRESIATRKGSFARRLNVKRGKGRRPYGILVTTEPGAHDVEASASGCILFITDPERPSIFNPEAIADAFDLTTAEARVVARLAMGTSLPDIAGNLKVSINTVRTLLARAMGKTATNTQVALVRMVLTNTGVWC